MKENKVVSLRRKDGIDDPLTEILRSGARRLIAQAVEAEFETFLASTADLVLADGRRRVVRHGCSKHCYPALRGPCWSGRSSRQYAHASLVEALYDAVWDDVMRDLRGLQARVQ
jgi:hypothetical protein